MALKIRLRQQGRTNCRTFRLVVTDAYAPRDGKYLESLGHYNPVAPKEELQLTVKPDRVQHWLDQGAQMSDNVANLIAKSDPALIKKYREKLLARKTKKCAKLREKRRAAAA